MKLKAFPKINLCLKVYKGLHEGKHYIDSVVMLYKQIYDTIIIKKSHDMYVCYEENGKEISISDCLVTKSLKYLHYKHNLNTNYIIKIIKRIPFGAGLGGGSADAAAVINYILKRNNPIQLNLKEMAIELGSDVPFFLSKYNFARIQKTGEVVSPIYNWQPKVEIHFNHIVSSTKQVFDSLEDDMNYVSKVNVDNIIQNHMYKQGNVNVVYNDLTKYIIQNYKDLQEIYKQYSIRSFFTGAGSAIVTLEAPHESKN